jgi:hypothetical protein
MQTGLNMRETLPCTPSQVHIKPEDAAREPRSDLSFSNFQIADLLRKMKHFGL